MSSRAESANCSVCGTPLLDGRRHDYGNRAYFNCLRCGHFGLWRAAERTLDTLLTDPRNRAVLSYGLRQTPRQGPDTLLLDIEACKKIVDAGILPTPQQQADTLILWLGANLPGPEQIVRINYAEHGAIINAPAESDFQLVVNGLIDVGLIRGDHLKGPDAVCEITLTIEGQARFEELRPCTASNRRAFYGNEVWPPDAGSTR